jgi:hypothetical protein
VRLLALKAICSAVFKPGTVENEPTEVWMVVPIEFKLH